MADIVLPQLSYQIMGILFKIHNELGPVHKEKNYQDAVEMLLKKNNIKYEREKEVELEVDGEKVKGFFIDFLIDNKLILELKATKFIKNEDIRQVSRYLKSSNLPLAIIANFKRNKLESKRVINPNVIDDYKKNSTNNREMNLGKYSGENSINSGRIRETNGKILGLDYGTRRIGLAISDARQTQAFSYDTLKVNGKTFDEIKKICGQELIDKIVVGLPLGLSGEYTAKTEEVVGFIEELENRTKMVVEMEDERWSSVEAAGREDDHGLDESAAQIILQQYLDMNHELWEENFHLNIIHNS